MKFWLLKAPSGSALAYLSPRNGVSVNIPILADLERVSRIFCMASRTGSALHLFGLGMVWGTHLHESSIPYASPKRCMKISQPSQIP